MSDVEGYINENDIYGSVDETSISGSIGSTDIIGSIDDEDISGVISQTDISGEITHAVCFDVNDFIPYENADRDADLNNKNLTNIKELGVNTGITLNGIRITQWPVGEWVNWGDVIGDINNQLDLMGKLSEKQDKLEYIPENVENKSSDINLGDSDILYPTQKAVKTYVDTVIDGVNYNQVEVFTINETILNQKYVILTKEITDINSVRVFVDDIGIRAQPGVDYSISDNYVYWQGYEFLTKLEIGEKLYIYYY